MQPENSNEVALSVQNVSKNFQLPQEKVNSLKSIILHFFRYISSSRKQKTQHALRNISLEVNKGEFFGIVGRNGSGKSTLLKMLAGIYQPTKGKIEVHGKLVPFIELGVGFSPELTGRQNVYLNGALLGFEKKEIDQLYDDIVDFAELRDFMDQKLKNYSSGMQVRLAFSMAVRAKADILLIDEVLAVGDADFQRKCFEYFKKLKNQHTTVVFVSHNMDAVREFCDRAMLIEDSKIVKIGSTDEIAEKYMKLFMKDVTNPQVHSESGERWGDGSAIFKSIDVNVTSKQITIDQVIDIEKDLSNPFVGFRIRNAAGLDITGTNTKVERKSLGELKAGTQLTIQWKMPNSLADGTYRFDPSFIYEDGITVADWWNDAREFTIKKNRILPYNIDPGFEVDVKTSSKG